MANPIITVDTSQVEQFLKVDLGELPKRFRTRRLVQNIATFVTARIKVRTLSGKDKDLRPFEGYAYSTKISRTKKGRQVSHVDLSDSGQMLAGLGYRIDSDTSATVLFLDAIQAKKAAHHQFGVSGTFLRGKARVRGAGNVSGLTGFGRFDATSENLTSGRASISIRNMPARPFFGIGSGDTLALTKIDDLFQDEIDRALGFGKVKTVGEFNVFTVS